MKYIDMESDPRRSHYEYFRTLAYPYVGLTADVRVDGLIRYAKERGGSPFLACLWAAAQAANAVPALRQRIVGDRVIELEHCDTSHTVAMPDETYRACRTDCRRTLEEFLVYGAQQQKAAMQRRDFLEEGDETELIFLSCIPWVRFTQVIQPAPIPADSNPRIMFGKFDPREDQVWMPLHIQCNHALVDGRHLGAFYQAFEEISLL